MGEGELMTSMRELSEVAAAVRTAQDRALAGRKRDGVAERVVRARATRLNRARDRRRTITRASGGGAAIVALAATLLLFVRTGGARAPLSFEVAGQPGAVGAFVSTSVAHKALRFSDGSDVEVAPDAALRVADVSANGADVVLERGTARTHVVPREGNRWTITAGPYRVHVKGTRFDTTWDPSASKLRVALTEGRVVVTGECLGEGRELRAGDVAEVHCAAKSGPAVRVTAALSPPSPTEETPAMPTTSPAAPVSTEPATREEAPAKAHLSRQETARARRVEASPAEDAGAAAVAQPAPPPTPTWAELARAGRVREALASAPTASILATGSAEDVMMLAEAGRRAGQNDVAERAYRALRARFAGTDESARATFLLGRIVAEASDRAQAEALFREYAHLAPRGVFAEEAAGRLLDLAVSRGDTAGARPLAQRYLEQFPKGASADRARTILLP